MIRYSLPQLRLNFSDDNLPSLKSFDTFRKSGNLLQVLQGPSGFESSNILHFLFGASMLWRDRKFWDPPLPVHFSTIPNAFILFTFCMICSPLFKNWGTRDWRVWRVFLPPPQHKNWFPLINTICRFQILHTRCMGMRGVFTFT